MPRHRRPCTKTGFSMIELMITVSIIGIIGAVALPMLTGTATSRLRAAASVLAADLQATQAESMTHGEDLRYIVFDTASHTWHIAPASDTTTPIDHPDSGQPYTRTLGISALRQLAGVTIDSYTLDTSSETNDNKLGYGLYGQLDQTEDATITLASGGNTITITINAVNGEVTIGELE